MDINVKMKQIAEYRMIKKQAEAALAELEKELKDYMLDEGLNVLIGDEHTATYKSVTSNRFDSAWFKADNPQMYEAYKRADTAMRFTFS